MGFWGVPFARRGKYFVLFLMVLGSLGLPACAELPPLIPRRVLFGNPEKDEARVSPDGRRLAYLAPREGVLNVYVRTLGRADDRAVTSETKRDIERFYWRGDGRHVLYLRDTGGDENFHLYQADVETGKTVDLTPFEGAT